MSEGERGGGERDSQTEGEKGTGDEGEKSERERMNNT